MRAGNLPLPRFLGRRRGLFRAAALVGVAFAATTAASLLGVARDYAFLHTSILTGPPNGHYDGLGRRLADRARRVRGSLEVVHTAGSVENVRRLAATSATTCDAAFALVQDGTPVPVDAGLELVGRLPDAESLLFFAKRGRTFASPDDLRGLAVGIGPAESGTAELVRTLLTDEDLAPLGLRFDRAPIAEQLDRVTAGTLDLAAMVTDEAAPMVRQLVRAHDLDLVELPNLEGLVARHPWLGLGRVPVGRWDAVRGIPRAPSQVARVDTLLVANACAHRAERVALLTMLAAEFPSFVRVNETRVTTPSLPLSAESRQFFATGEPEVADRYFPWLVNLMSPTYWVYLVMAVTVLFNAMRIASRFRLWRIDQQRAKLEARLGLLVGPRLTQQQMRALPPERALPTPEARSEAEAILLGLLALRDRCHRQAASLVVPMGDEIYYRYQEARTEESATTVALLLERRIPAAG